MKPKLNIVETDSYDKYWGPYGQYTDWVTESTYYSEKSLTLDEFKEILSKHHSPCGEITYRKFRQTYGDGTIIYKHVCEEVMY